MQSLKFMLRGRNLNVIFSFGFIANALEFKGGPQNNGVAAFLKYHQESIFAEVKHEVNVSRNAFFPWVFRIDRHHFRPFCRRFGPETLQIE